MATFRCFDWENDHEGNAQPFNADSAKEAAEAFADDHDNGREGWAEERFVGVVDEHGAVTTWRVTAKQTITYAAEEA